MRVRATASKCRVFCRTKFMVTRAQYKKFCDATKSVSARLDRTLDTPTFRFSRHQAEAAACVIESASRPVEWERLRAVMKVANFRGATLWGRTGVWNRPQPGRLQPQGATLRWDWDMKISSGTSSWLRSIPKIPRPRIGKKIL